MNSCTQTQAEVFNCSGQNLLHVPIFPRNTRIIDLSRNNITTINDSFHGLEHLHFLNISKNEITTIYVSNVRSLRNLRILDLSGNYLRQGSFSFPTKPFPLIELRIQQNLYDAYPDVFISLMPSLRILHIDVFEGFMFGNTFPQLRNLTEIQLYPRNSFRLRNDSFHALRYSQIKSLYIDFSYFVYAVEPNIFSPFHHLKILTFNIGMRCNIRQALRALYGLRGRRMEYLNLANNILNNARATELREQDIYYLTTMCIKRVDLSRCSIFRIPYSIAKSRFANCLEEISIGNNDFQDDDFFPIISMLSYRNIISFECSYPTKSEVDVRHRRKAKSTILVQSQRMINFTLSCSMSLKKINITGFDLSQQHIPREGIRFVGKGLEVLDMAFTKFGICQKLGSPFIFDTRIKYLDLTNWVCRHLVATFLNTIPTLETLIFRNAELSEGLSHDPNGILLKGLFKLRSLDMGSNRLTHIHDGLFLDQTKSLRTLSLRNNIFHHIPKAIQNAHQLTLLDMENNKLSSLSKTDIITLDQCSESFLKLSRNPFVCSCENLQMIKWLEENRNRILDFEYMNCTSGEPLKSLSGEMRQFELKCLGTFWLEFSASLCIALIVAIISSAICYRYRVYIEYMYLILVSSKPKLDCDDRYGYDGFISYSAKDTDWVTQVLYKHLAHEMKLKICIHHKDFIPGRPIANEILRCIDESRKVIFVITRNFLESDWGNYELEMARIHAFRSGRSGLLLILKDDLLIEEMPDLLKKMWWKVVCMKWPEQETSEERKLLWHNLEIAMET